MTKTQKAVIDELKKDILHNQFRKDQDVQGWTDEMNKEHKEQLKDWLFRAELMLKALKGCNRTIKNIRELMDMHQIYSGTCCLPNRR